MGFRSARKAARKTIEETARYMEVSPVSVWMWESGQTTPRVNRLKKLAEFYGVTVDELLKE